MRKIPLTRNKKAIVDDADYALLSQRSWHATNHANGSYAAARITVEGKSSIVYMHRFILGCSVGMEVDHKNGNPLDNRRANLRTCTHKENISNSKCQARSFSGYKGVWLQRNSSINPWIVVLGNPRKYAGSFPTAELAAEAYNKEALAMYGEFARLNVIRKGNKDAS